MAAAGAAAAAPPVYTAHFAAGNNPTAWFGLPATSPLALAIGDVLVTVGTNAQQRRVPWACMEALVFAVTPAAPWSANPGSAPSPAPGGDGRAMTNESPQGLGTSEVVRFAPRPSDAPHGRDTPAAPWSTNPGPAPSPAPGGDGRAIRTLPGVPHCPPPSP